MMKYKQKNLKHPRGLRWWIPRQWTFLVWLLIVLAAAALYLEQTSLSGFTGIVETEFEPVAPLETSRLSSLAVTMGQTVQSGDVLAKMDTTLLDAELAIEEAMLLEAESSISGYQRDILQLAQRFDDAIRRAETELRQERMAQAQNKAELDSMLQELKRREDLLAQRLISETEVSELRPRIAALEEGQASTPSIIQSLEQALDEARTNRKELDEWLRIKEDETISSAIRAKLEARSDILANSLEQRRQQLANYTLRANRGGVVSRVLHTPGDVVPAGDEILRIVSPQATHVVGFLPEHHVHDLEIGDKLTASRRQGASRAPVTIRVETVAPEVESMPGRLSPIRGTPLRGRRVHFRIEGDTDLLPGETVQVYKRTANVLDAILGKSRGEDDAGDEPDA